MSSTKGVFFINLVKKIFRVIGYVICGLLLALCILLIISAAVFGARNTVDVFGFNIYIVQNDTITTAPKNSAVIVQKCSAYELEAGNLALYLGSDADSTPALGYVKNIQIMDGTHYVTVTVNYNDTTFAESSLVGRADYSSLMLGKTITFIRTPLGVLFIAVLPCVALVAYDILRAAAATMPPPEVIPQVKNGDADDFEDESGQVLSAARATGSKISVNNEGKATYSRNQNAKKPESAGNVLYSYSGRQQRKTEERPIIPLTDKNADISKPAFKLPEKPSSGYTSIINIGEPTAEPKQTPTAEPRTPNNVAVGRYAQNTESAPEPEKPQQNKASGKTAELPSITKKDTGDAFFAQTTTPTFNEDAIRRIASSPAKAPQLGGRSEERSSAIPGRTARTARKRSTQLIAQKGMDELFSDDDDTLDRRRRSSADSVVDNIMGTDRRR